jgi:putative transposase
MVVEDKDLSEVPSAQKRRLAKPIIKYTETAGSRDEGIYLAYRSGGYTIKAISDILDYTIRQSARLLRLSRIQDSRLDPILRYG